jgi:hypothetical protein
MLRQNVTTAPTHSNAVKKEMAQDRLTVVTHHEAATCDISGLSMGYGYWPAENGYIGGLVRPATDETAVSSQLQHITTRREKGGLPNFACL